MNMDVQDEQDGFNSLIDSLSQGLLQTAIWINDHPVNRVNPCSFLELCRLMRVMLGYCPNGLGQTGS
jgi:hypothetical protein